MTYTSVPASRRPFWTLPLVPAFDRTRRSFVATRAMVSGARTSPAVPVGPDAGADVDAGGVAGGGLPLGAADDGLAVGVLAPQAARTSATASADQRAAVRRGQAIVPSQAR